MRGQVKNATKNIQFLEPKLNFARVHCIGKERRRGSHDVNCAEEARTGADKAWNDECSQVFQSQEIGRRASSSLKVVLTLR